MPNLTSSRASAIAISVALAVALPAWSAAATPEETAASREHFQKGTAFYDLGKYLDAVREFEAAYQAKPDPALLYNLAQSHRLAGNPEQALHFYKTYLRYVPKAPNRAEIEGRITALEKLAEQKSATQSTPPNQTFPPSSTSPTGPPADSGGNGNPAPAPPDSTAPPPTYPGGPTGAPPAPNGAPMGAAPMPAISTPSTPEADHAHKLKLAGLVVGGVGVVSLIAATVFGVQAQNAAKKIQDRAAAGGVYDPALQAVDSDGRSAQTKEAAYAVIGIGALAAGGFLYYYGSQQQQRAAERVAILPSASPKELGATLRVTF
jgi:tetratricopeptide (TPR) repeat protein